LSRHLLTLLLWVTGEQLVTLRGSYLPLIVVSVVRRAGLLTLFSLQTLPDDLELSKTGPSHIKKFRQ